MVLLPFGRDGSSCDDCARDCVDETGRDGRPNAGRAVNELLALGLWVLRDPSYPSYPSSQLLFSVTSYRVSAMLAWVGCSESLLSCCFDLEPEEISKLRILLQLALKRLPISSLDPMCLRTRGFRTGAHAQIKASQTSIAVHK